MKAKDKFSTTDQAVAAFRAGKMVVIVDGADRENEGDLAIAAEFATAEAINFMVTHGRGLVCLPIVGSRLDELDLPLMCPRTDPGMAAFTISVDARDGVTSGISASDRARTVQAILDPRTQPQDLARPGHLFPLRYAEGGVLTRRGHTEASVDLARLGDLYPATVICEVMNRDGTMARLPELLHLAKAKGLPIVSVGQVLARCRLRLLAPPPPQQLQRAS